ncbi:FAD-dependent monooxygenase [Streptomyces sp. NPDC089919]|uniref:FAD-dependent monooxygenase n=1 Tax=Streptomyces sp. NPDC089919 TaxID=3155188 RepID=UPI003420B9AF
MGRGHVAVAGGGPAGLFLARLIRLADPATEVRLHDPAPPTPPGPPTDRAPLATPGPPAARAALPAHLVQPPQGHGPVTDTLAAVLSGRVLGEVRRVDPQTYERIVAVAVPARGLELRHPRATLRYGGFERFGLPYDELLRILREQAVRAGVRFTATAVELDTPAASLVAYTARYAAPDSAPGAARDDHEPAGRAAGSGAAPDPAPGQAPGPGTAPGREAGPGTAPDPTPRQAPDPFGTTVRSGPVPWLRLRTEARFAGVGLAFAESVHGHFALRVHPYGAGLTEVIALTDPVTRRAAWPAPYAEERAADLLGELFEECLDGHKLVAAPAGGRWAQYPVVRSAHWSDGRSVVLGEAAHTVHPATGSGPAMALEDAVALAAAVARHAEPAAALAEYERVRRPRATRAQDRAERGMRWWEGFGRRLRLPPAQFGLHYLSRTAAPGYGSLRRRFPEQIGAAETVYRGATAGGPAAHAVGAPFLRGGLRLPNRLLEVLTEPAPDPSAAPLSRSEARSAGVRAAGERGAGLVLARVPYGPRKGLYVALVPGYVEQYGPAPAVPPAVGRDRRDLPVHVGEALPGCLDGDVPLFGELVCPRGPAGLTEGIRALAARGVTGVLLHPDPLRRDWWSELLEQADRVRNDAGLAVAVRVPDGWTPEPPDRPGRDPWSARLQLALVSGRVDLVASAPRRERS